MNFFQKIKDGLLKTKQAMISRFQKVINSFTKIDEDLFEELEETMIMSDIGVDTSVEICELLRKKVKERGITDPKEIMGLIQEIISEMMGEDVEIDTSTKPSIIMVIGVNGVGKTTTIGKLCYQYRQQGKKVLVAAADTFRAAAIDQLEIWTKRAGVELVKHSEGSDPGAVIFDAITAGKARGADIIICDTAGRLHNKKNLMNELAKINRIVSQQAEGCARETLLVLDATTGQNAVSQAKLFSETADITGIVLTKLDGTAKGGIVISIKNELNIPVKLIGVGEKIDDLQPFNSSDFVKALFDMDMESAEKSNYDRIVDDGQVTTKEDFTIVPNVPPVEDSKNTAIEQGVKVESEVSTEEKVKLENMDEKEIFEKIQSIKNAKDRSRTVKDSRVEEKAEVNSEVKESLEVKDRPISTQFNIKTYVPNIEEKFIEDFDKTSPTIEFNKVTPEPVQKVEDDFKPIIEDIPTVIEDEPLPNREEVEPISDSDYYDGYYQDEGYYEDEYYDDGEYYEDEYYDEDQYYEYYEGEEAEEVQKVPLKKESFFSKLFGKNKDKPKKDKSSKKDKNNKKKK